MKLLIKNGIHEDEVNIAQISQWGGQNIISKTFALNSIDYYFSTHKYDEFERFMENNISVDGEDIGRKYFEVIRISSRKQLLSMIQFSKSSLLSVLVKDRLNGIDLQIELNRIEQILDVISKTLNNDFFGRIGDVGIRCNQQNIWEMVQQTQVIRSDGSLIEEASTYELMSDLLDLIFENQKIKPGKRMIILENIDHIVTPDEYRKVIEQMKRVVNESDTWFILTTSLDRYIDVKEELIEGIAIFGDKDIIQFPESEHLKEFVDVNWPCNERISVNRLLSYIERVGQICGNTNNLMGLKEMIFLKLLDKENLLEIQRQEYINKTEIEFLLD